MPLKCIAWIRKRVNCKKLIQSGYLGAHKDSGVCSVEGILDSLYLREIVVIKPGFEFKTGITHSCLFFIQSASQVWEVSCAIMYGNTEGTELNKSFYSGFFNSGKEVDAYRVSNGGEIIIKNNGSDNRTVYYYALKLFV